MMEKKLKSDVHGQKLPTTIEFSDREKLADLSDLLIIKINIFYDEKLKIIKGFQATYLNKVSQKTILGGNNVIIKENSDGIEQKEFSCEINDFIQAIGGSFSKAGDLENLILTSHMDVVFKVGEESVDCSRFLFDIKMNEIPICLFGGFSNSYGISFLLSIIIFLQNNL